MPEKRNLTIKQENVKNENKLINITYESIDQAGRKYIINVETGTLDNDKPEIIYMSDVKAKIILLDKSVIYINSLNAEYNNVNYDTKFENNIELRFLENEIHCNNLNIFFKDNLLEAYKK